MAAIRCVFFSDVFHALVIFPEKEVMADQGLLFWVSRRGVFGEEKSRCNSIRNESEFEEIHRFKMVSENFTIGRFAFIV